MIEQKPRSLIYHPRFQKFCIILVLVLLCAVPDGQTRHVIMRSLADAYIQVTTFVAVTLLAFYVLERHTRFDLAGFMARHKKFQVPAAAFLGVIPGCGGTIIVITHYVTGRATFGAMVAALTATMGDAAFLLLATAPMTALYVFAISFVAALVMGVITERIHPQLYTKFSAQDAEQAQSCPLSAPVQFPLFLQRLWYGLLVPGVILGVLAAFQFDFELYPMLDEAVIYFGAFSVLVTVSLWALLDEKGSTVINMLAHPSCSHDTTPLQRTMFETGFVTIWVVLAFLLFELSMLWLSVDLAVLFKTHAIYVPLLATMIGLIPGCGPQIIVTTLYVNGIVPFSAQIANALSNDGDALFPAIALAPRMAILATIYTTIPALVIGYGFYAYEIQ